MRIGIVTVQDAANFGSYLQAYALYKVLENMGHDVAFIRTSRPEGLRKVYYSFRISRHMLMHPIKDIIGYFQDKKKYELFMKDQEKFKVVDQYQESEFDKVILGSDEIWNVTMRCFENEKFYGKNMKNVMAYAISCGKATIEDFAQHDNLKNLIKEVNPILVRDENTHKLVQSITGKNSETVCDPTFLLDVSEFTGEVKDNYIQKHDYILVYSYPVYISKHFQSNIQRFAKEKNLKIVTACFRMDWCDYFLNCSPLGFCEALKNAKYVVTTTFHGSIFSFLNHKQFVSAPFSIKVSDVLNRVGLENVIINSEQEYESFKEKLEGVDIHYEDVDRKILEMRQTSLEILNQYIGE